MFRTIFVSLSVAVLLPATLFAQRSSGSEVEDQEKSFRVNTDSPFRLRVEVDAGEVRVAPGSSSNEARVRLTYDADQFHHSFRFNEQRNSLEILFDKDKWLKHDDGHMRAELDVELPTAADLDLDFEITAGEVEMQLGGLRVANFALETVAGEVNVDFEQPNKIEMETLDLNTKIGESNFRRLGNARFRNAEIDGGIGELTIDFSGSMLKDASAAVDLDIGETKVILPRDAGAKVSVSKFLFLSHIDMPFEMQKEGRYYYSQNYNESSRNFQLRIDAGIGECRIENE